MADIATSRLRAQRLIGEPLTSPVEVVRLLGAVQAQDYTGAKWALGQRAVGATDAEIDRLVDEGQILRTHVLRPTWHFVLPQDIRWLLDLTGPRVRRALAGRYRQLGIDESDVDRTMEVLRTALAGGQSLTRPELHGVVHGAGIVTEGLRLQYLLMAGELDGVIVSGPRRGKQITHALLAERAPDAGTLDRPEALAELTRRYFRSHGPAQVQDFVWWSGLTVSDARWGLAYAAGDLQHAVIEGKEYWSAPDSSFDGPVTGVAHLLPNWDEYTVGYRDREATLSAERPFDPDLFSFGSVLSNVVTVDGRVRGSWRRVSTTGSVRIELRMLDRLDRAEALAVEKVGQRLSRFLERPVELAWL